MRQRGFSSPRKGTKLRKLVLLLLRPHGLSAREAETIGLCHLKAFAPMIGKLAAEGGFDIQRIGEAPGPKPRYIYRIVGRHRWSGTYRSFIGEQ